MNSLQEALVFLVKASIDLYFFVGLLRFLFQYLQIDFYNPFSQFVLKLTDPALKPLRAHLPRSQKIDFASLVLLFGLKIVELFLITLITKIGLPHFFSLILWPTAEILRQTINLFFFAIILVAAFSWFAPKMHTPFSSLLVQLTEPLLEPARKVIPAQIGFDLSPLVVLIILKFLDILLVAPLTHWALYLST